VEVARDGRPGLDVRGLVGQGAVASVLLGAAAVPELFCVGSRGRGSLAALLLGSVGVDVARYAPRPVVVVRAGARNGHRLFAGHVVVGVDGQPHSRAALEFAFAEAGRRQAPLVAVHAAVLGPVDQWRDEAFGELHQEVHYPEWDRLEAAVEPYRVQYPKLRVKLALHQAPAAAALLRAAAGAHLLVVGTVGAGRVGGVLGGSVSRSVLLHAGCPVAVVPASGTVAAGRPGAAPPAAEEAAR
jgi:nucleotide-binding universal stress UspA family protein